MKRIETIQELLKFIVTVSKHEKYWEGFYEYEPDYDENGIISYSCNPLKLEVLGEPTEFFGGMIGEESVGFTRNKLLFRACGIDNDSRTHLAFAPNESIFRDECWCIDIAMDFDTFTKEVCSLLLILQVIKLVGLSKLGKPPFNIR